MNWNLRERLNPGRKDFQIILALFIIDLGFTVYGIRKGGVEASPFFRAFTSSATAFIAGSLIYLSILEILNETVTGRIRKTLASTAIGMHLSGVLSWILYLSSIERGMSVQYIFMIFLSLTTALAYSELEKRSWTY